MISVILNVYKRSYLLEKQIESIKNQSVSIKSENIHIWYNRSDEPQQFPEDEKIKTYICNWNTKFFGRFTIPLFLNTEYIAVFDDDTIPQKNWIKNCLETINTPEYNGILGGSGVILRNKSYRPYYKVGWNGRHSNIAERVDLVGHAWFFRREWSKYLWYEKPYTFDNGEDIMFSFLSQKYGNINTFVPPHPENDISLWSTSYKEGVEFGSDDNASWKMRAHNTIRDEVCIHCINNGWKTVNNIG